MLQGQISHSTHKHIHLDISTHPILEALINPRSSFPSSHPQIRNPSFPNRTGSALIMGSKSKIDGPYGDGASPGKIFIGGLSKDTTYGQFHGHFGKYGEIIDSVIMKDRFTGAPRGFGFITYADPSVVDKVIEDTHVINGKQVEIKRTIPKGAAQQQSTRDFKTKKIFVGGIPSTVTEDEFRNFFSTFGEVVEHQIIHDHDTNRSRGFGFIIFDSEEVVDGILSNGNRLDFAGTQVEIKKAEPKKPSNPPPGPAYRSNPRARSFGDNYGSYGGGSYGGFDGGFGPGPYRNPGGMGGRVGGYSGYGPGVDYGAYGGYGNSGMGGYLGESSVGYSSRFGSYGGGYGGGYGPGGLGGYGRGDMYGGYGNFGYGNNYDNSSGAGYSGPGGSYGKGGYSGNSRYHPYGR